MNEKFDNALDIAGNIGGDDMRLTSLSYRPDDNSFTAYYASKTGTSYLLIREAPYKELRSELELNHSEDGE